MAAKGFIGQKMRVIFRGPWMTYWKERGEGKGAVLYIILLRKLVSKTIPTDVVKEHNIGKALRDQDRLEGAAKKVDSKNYMLAFNVELEAESLFKLISKLMALEEEFIDMLRKDKRFKGMKERQLLKRTAEELPKLLIKAMTEEDKDDREIYFNYCEPVIREAESKGDTEAMMAKVAQMFKTKEDISRFAAIAFKWGARAERINFIGLRADLRGLERIINGMKKGKINVAQLDRSLREMDNKIVTHVRKHFKNTYLLLKRDLLLDLVLLALLREDNKQMQEYVREHFMPQAPVLKNINDVRKIKAEIAEHGHIIAQGLRRLIGSTRNAKRRLTLELRATGKLAA